MPLKRKKAAKMIVPEDVAAVLTTEDEQKLYRLIMQTAKAAQYCRFNYEVTTRIIDSVKDLRSSGKDNEQFWQEHIKSSDFLSKSVTERIAKMDDHMCNFCILLRPLYEYSVGQGTVLQNIDLILEEFIDCMVPGKAHLVKNIFEEAAAEQQKAEKADKKDAKQDAEVAATEEDYKPVKRKRRAHLTMQAQQAHEKKLRKQRKQRNKNHPGARSLEKEISIPSNISNVLRTEEEQKVYKVFVKTCEMCKFLNSRKAATFRSRASKEPKAYARETLARMRGIIQKKDYRFNSGSGWASYKASTTPEQRVDDILRAMHNIFCNLDITDINTKDILEDYDGFNEKFDRIMEECT